jgi:hypothetical protein
MLLGVAELVAAWVGADPFATDFRMEVPKHYQCAARACGCSLRLGQAEVSHPALIMLGYFRLSFFHKSVLFFLFSFPFWQTGSGADPPSPLLAGQGWQSESQPVLNMGPEIWVSHFSGVCSLKAQIAASLLTRYVTRATTSCSVP